MTWVKIDDRAMLHPKLRAVGPRGVTAWLCALSAAAGIETDGVLTDEDVYPHWSAFGGRQSLRTELHKLERAGLVHFQSGTEGEMGGEWITSAKNHRKKPIVFAIHDYIDYQFSGEQKAQRKRAARERQQRHRAKGRKPVSRRDGKGCHAPPDPEPDPEPLSKESKSADAPRSSQFAKEIREIWEHYLGSPFVANRNGYKLDQKTEAVIDARLREGYVIADLKAAIDGVDDWHRVNGQTALATILKDGQKVEKFKRLAASPKANGTSHEEVEAARRVEAERRHSEREFAKLEDDRRNKGPVPMMDELAPFINTARSRAKGRQSAHQTTGTNRRGGS